MFFRIIDKCMRPVAKEWPYIFLITILIATDAHRILYPGDYPASILGLLPIRLCTGFTAGYLAALFIGIFKSLCIRRLLRLLFIIVVSIPFLIQSISFGLWWMHISPSLLNLFAETNACEVSSVTDIIVHSLVFRQTVIVYAALLIIFFIFSQLRERINAAVSRRGRKAVTWAAACFCAAAFAVCAVSTCHISRLYTVPDHVAMQAAIVDYEQYPNCTDNLSRCAFALKVISLMSKDIGDWENLQHEFLTNGEARCGTSDSLCIALVIGESFIRSHSSIYGYELSTNPRLQRLIDNGNLIPFSNVITPQKNTSASLRTILSINDDRTGLSWRNCISVPVMFRRAGYEVNFFDNQNTGCTSIYDFALGRFIFAPVMTGECYNSYFSSSKRFFDLEFLDSINLGSVPAVSSLNIYHLRGQHLWAEYPREPQWERFTSADIPRQQERPWLNEEKLQRIADYDNATYYNDSVVARIFGVLSAHNSIAFYFPDHGEEVFDYRDSALRKPPVPGMEKEYISHILEVPFFIYMSDDFIRLHPEKAADIRAAALRPFSLADIGQLLMGTAGIRTPLYRPSRDPISPAFSTETRPLPDCAGNGLPSHI